MDAEDNVVSEVHTCSNQEKIAYKDASRNSAGTSKDTSIDESNKLSDSVCVKNESASMENKDDDTELYVCLLGSNGQVVLWSSEFETVLSRFEFSYPSYLIDKTPINLQPTLDDDDDLQVVRKQDLNKKDGIVIIEHQNSSTLDLVGEQVWRGALYLADFILHNLPLFKNANVLEVASGVGLTSLVAGMVAKTVTITDVNKGDILNLIRRNIVRNKDILKASTNVQEIDFFNLKTIDESNIAENNVTIILAADVVYHNLLTDAFLNTILHLMQEKPNKVMFIALEKRYVFSFEEVDTVAPCYEHFKSGLQWLKDQMTHKIQWNIEELPPDFPQYFTYERTKHLVLWKIEAIIK